MIRRDFCIALSLAAAGPVLPVRAAGATPVPPHLSGHAGLFARDPRAAAQAWFREARFGLFVHWNVKANEEGKRDVHHFRADGFDAEAIVDMAAAAQMRYVNFTVYHSGGPHMWDTAISQQNSRRLAERDLTGELAEACAARGMGLFFYMHVSLNRTHEGRWERVQTAYRELLTRYGPIAGLWLDTVHDYHRNRHYYPHLAEQYALIRALQPQALISFCEGANGQEDFLGMEHHLRRARHPDVADAPREICTTLQVDAETGRGQSHWFDNKPQARRRTPDEVEALLAMTASHGANLLLNTGLRGDGSLHPIDESTLRETGRRIRERGWPRPQAPREQANEEMQ